MLGHFHEAVELSLNPRLDSSLTHNSKSTLRLVRRRIGLLFYLTEEQLTPASRSKNSKLTTVIWIPKLFR